MSNTPTAEAIAKALELKEQLEATFREMARFGDNNNIKFTICDPIMTSGLNPNRVLAETYIKMEI